MLTRQDEDLWTSEGGPISFLGFPYTLRMTVVRLSDGSLWVHSPVGYALELKKVVDEIGPVSCIVSPNRYHHLYMGEWGAAYPDAKLFGPADLLRKRRDLRFTAALREEPDPVWARDVDQCHFAGSFFWKEVVFFHRASGTVIFGDLVENHDPARFSLLQRIFARRNGMFGSTPVNLRLTFYNRSLARQSLRKIIAWRPKRVIVMHGPIIDKDAGGFLQRAFAWLDACPDENQRTPRHH